MRASNYLPLLFVFILLASSCRSISGLVNGAGRVVDGSAFAEKTIKTYKSTDKTVSFRLVSLKDGGRQCVFSLNKLPFIQFYGTEPDETGLFFVTRAHFLFSNSGGWLEGDIDASGMGLIVTPGVQAEFSLQAPVNLTEVKQGGIKRYDRRLYGDRALAELRGREGRIQLVTEWMREWFPPATLATQHDFENYWRPILLPETVSKKLRPPRYDELNAAQNGNAEYSYGEGIKWNTAYTRELFPEHLQQFRDSGSLLRDWEEAVSWFYMDYYWNIIIRDLYEKHYLT
ncbi:MAG: hypothetical protein LBB47_05915 [Spirochaetaceae bacterium]|jgi:hypothetical protein|nr:hypothetical protein [Spirochaetaceae bacterium]